jgi:hypothetical protein
MKTTMVGSLTPSRERERSILFPTNFLEILFGKKIF